MTKVVTRFAPSPTGSLHIGSVRTALFSWLYARRHNGKFRLRIEDTDRRRSKQQFTDNILESLNWLGLDYDDEIVYQSSRLEIYQQQAQKLVEAGVAYYCNCSRERLDELRKDQMQRGMKPRYDRKCRDLNIEPSNSLSTVVRFKNPIDGDVIVNDFVQGRVVYKNDELDDLIIVRSDNTPTYNFSVVVDEIDMEVTHVIRGDDHLNNTPRQINLFEAFNYPLPKFGHVPLILSPAGKKLSKRDSVEGVLELRDAGYLPQAVINYLVRLGWSHGDQEIFSIEELLRKFDVNRLGRSASSLNAKKLEWINHQHLMNLDSTQIEELATPFFANLAVDIKHNSPNVISIFNVQKTRSKTIKQFAEQSVYFYRDIIEYDSKAAKKFLTLNTISFIKELIADLAKLKDWKKEAIHSVIADVVKRHSIKFGAIAQPVRVALTGGTVSPSIDVTVELIGKRKVIERLNRAIQWIENKNRKSSP